MVNEKSLFLLIVKYWMSQNRPLILNVNLNLKGVLEALYPELIYMRAPFVWLMKIHVLALRTVSFANIMTMFTLVQGYMPIYILRKIV
jgi:hypothetical protein